MIKLLIWLARFLVGGLFIFSGLIKANDALGFSYKLEEYFEKFSEVFSNSSLAFLSYPMDFFAQLALPLSIIIVVSEIVLGVLTITGTYIKKVSWMLLLMIVFFTILTFVSWKFELVKSCGCFGDAIPLTPFESFLKDLILLVLIIFIFVFRKNTKSTLSPIGDKVATWVSIVISFLFTWYCYQHLPLKDFRAYAPGKNILPQMEVIKGNPLTLYKLKHKELGVIVEFSDYPTDYNNWEYIENNNVDGELKIFEIEVIDSKQRTKVLEIPDVLKEKWTIISEKTEVFKADEDPKIMQLSANNIYDRNEDFLNEMLTDSSMYFWLVIRDLNKLGTFENFNGGIKFHPSNFGKKTVTQILDLSKITKNTSFKFYSLCSEGNPLKIEAFKHEMNIDFPIYNCDDTELKTMIRSSPGLILLKGDSIIEKWHYNDIPSLEVITNKYIKE